jgi:hypothetical protein
MNSKVIRTTLVAPTPPGRQLLRSAMTGLKSAVALIVVLACSPMVARADVVLDWNLIAMSTASVGQNPFAQARYMAITQLAVFEAVNAITGDYEPYVGTVVAPAGASADAAATTAAYRVLKSYFPGAATLDTAYAASLAAIPDGSAKTDGIATGEAAAAQMIALRAGDGSSPAEFYLPESSEPGVWQTTPSCSPAGGILFHWHNVTPFGIPSVAGSPAWMAQFLPGPPPGLTSTRYAKDYREVKSVGSLNSTERPQDRADVVRLFTVSSPSFVFNLVARQVAVAQGKSLSENARALALLNMATNDSLVASFGTKYYYLFWRPETAIRAGDLDGNAKTEPDPGFAPFIATPCFPSYPSNHASGSNSAAEILRRLYGAGGHDITVANPAIPDVTLHYTRFNQITDDIDDARVYGGIHFRFEQEAGGRLGRAIAKFIYKHNLRSARDPR